MHVLGGFDGSGKKTAVRADLFEPASKADHALELQPDGCKLLAVFQASIRACCTILPYKSLSPHPISGPPSAKSSLTSSIRPVASNTTSLVCIHEIRKNKTRWIRLDPGHQRRESVQNQ